MLFAQNTHGRYCIPNSSAYRFASQAILDGRVHEPDTIECIIKAAQKQEGLVVHAGAFFGDFLPALHTAGLVVVAFEPHPDNWLHAIGTLHLNQITDCDVHCAALGATERHAKLVTADGDLPLWGGSYIAAVGDVQCVVRSLDKVIEDRSVSVIHLDVERYEEQALQGALRTIKRCRPALILETVPRAWMETHLFPLGYRETGTAHHNTIFTPVPLNV